MLRIWLAIQCFFAVLLARRLPEAAVAFLPTRPPGPALPPQEAELIERPLPAEATATRAATAKLAEPATTSAAVNAEAGAVKLLSLLQREGRLLDFLQEEIDDYSDAQVGSAVRDIHRGCRRALAEHLPLEPVLSQVENSMVRIDPGFDPARIRLIGNVVGEPPFTGTLRHHGWRTGKVALPATAPLTDPFVIAPAEVELG
jgi:hypothetical protein